MVFGKADIPQFFSELSELANSLLHCVKFSDKARSGNVSHGKYEGCSQTIKQN